jgi:hypothetical protein
MKERRVNAKMGKAMKAIVIIAAAMIAAGVILCAVGLAFGGLRSVHFGPRGFYIDGSTDGSGDGDISRRVDDFDDVDIDVGAYAIVLREADAYGIEVRSLYTRETPEVRVEDGVLTVYGDRDASRRGWRGVFDILPFAISGEGFDDLDEAPTIVISYPRGARFGDVNVKSAAAGVDIEDIRARVLSVDCTAGRLDIEDAEADALRVSLNAGACEIENARVGEAVFDLDAGSLSARDFDCGNLDGSFHLGGVDVRGSLRGDVNITADMGDVSIETDLPKKDYRVELDVGLGSATVDGREASGVLAGAQYGDSDSAYTIRVKANMGSVEIDFD